MSFKEFLQKLNLESFHAALLEVTGLEDLEDYVKHVEEEDLEGLLEPPHGMRKPQLRKLWSALLELRQQKKATPAPARAPPGPERANAGDRGAAKGHPASWLQWEAPSRPRWEAASRSSGGDSNAAAAPAAGAEHGGAAAADKERSWSWREASRRARADLAELQERKRKLESASSAERASSSSGWGEPPAKAAKKPEMQDPKEMLQMEKAILVLQDLIGKEECERAGLASRSPGDVRPRFKDLSELYLKLSGQSVTKAFGPRPYKALAARYAGPSLGSRDRPVGARPEKKTAGTAQNKTAGTAQNKTAGTVQKKTTGTVQKKTTGIALEVTAEELERRQLRRLRFDAKNLQRRGVPTVLDGSGPDRLQGLVQGGGAEGGTQASKPPQPAAGKEQELDDDDDTWGDWTAPAIPVSRSLQQTCREGPGSNSAQPEMTPSELPANASPTSKEPADGSEVESDPYLCAEEEGEGGTESDSSVPDVEEA